MLDNTVTRLFQRRLNAHAQRERVHQETLHSRQTVFNRIIEVTGILWPQNMLSIAPHAVNIFAPSNLWGLRGPELDEGKPSPLIFLYLQFTMFPDF